MEVLYPGVSTWQDYELHTDQEFHSGGSTIDVAGNAIYRIYGEISNVKTVFELALRTALKLPADLYGFQTALRQAAADMKDTDLQAAVESVLTAMQPQERLLGGEPSAWREAKKEADRLLREPPGPWDDDEDDESEAKPRRDGG